MKNPCFFCDVQTYTDKNRILESDNFFARYDDYPISPGHAEIIIKEHVASFFDLTPIQLQEMYELMAKVKKVIDKEFAPDAYNIGINDGEAAGRTQHHLHVHLIPRYTGDVEDSRGGVRYVIPTKANYIHDLKNTDKEKYIV
jgi:diadenosine tetraphosphate (Ap4A) HIT family hydrolase